MRLIPEMKRASIVCVGGAEGGMVSVCGWGGWGRWRVWECINKSISLYTQRVAQKYILDAVSLIILYLPFFRVVISGTVNEAAALQHIITREVTRTMDSGG